MMLKLLLILIGLNCISSQLYSPLDLPNKDQQSNNNQVSDQLNNELNKKKDETLLNVQSNIQPSIQLILIIHPYNKFNELSFVLSGIEQQDYPKDRVNILIQTEIYNSVNQGEYDRTVERFKFNDLTIKLLKSWKNSIEFKYHRFELKITELDDGEGEFIIDYWSTNRYARLMNLKLYAFNYALNQWADFCIFQDADVILTNLNTFKNILNNQVANQDIIAPMLYSFNLYSNFWAGLDSNGIYYKRTDDYVPILERQNIGRFQVPMIYSFVFINLRNAIARSLKLRHDDLNEEAKNKIPFDDLIVFAKSVESLNLTMYVDNNEIYGFVMPSIDKLDLNKQKQNIIDLELECLIETNQRFKIANKLKQFHYPIDHNNLHLKIDKIYVINLKRRKERAIYMRSVCGVLGLQCELVNAIDGQLLDKQYLIESKISVMKGYLDPFHKRPMTYGEIGCFMSHYNIWLDILNKNQKWSIVFEDDVRFEKDFIAKFKKMFNSILENDDDDNQIDFIYLGRKREGKAEEEVWFNNYTVYPTYSYWTIGYLISLNGAKKLIESQPLDQMIPVDEYLPILYNKHPNTNWSQHFKKRNLNALSAYPVLIQPLHYVGDEQYVSDTEDSNKLQINHIEL